MSLTDQAFVKAFARRNRNTDASPQQAATSKPSSDELTLDERVADSATLWVDPTENKLARGDSPAPAVPRPHIDPSPVVARPEPAWVIPADSVASPSPVPTPVQPQAQALQPSPPAPEVAANAAVDNIAELVSSLQQIHTAYGTIDSSEELMWVESTTMPATKVRPTEDAPAEIAQRAAAAPAEMPTTEYPATEYPATEYPATEYPATESPAPITPAPAASVGVATGAPASERDLYPSKAAAAKTVVDPQPAAKPEPLAERPSFQAAWEVDVFDIPKTVADLFFDESLFQNLSDRMGEAVAGGLRTMLVTSVQRGEGRSSVAIGIALAAAASGVRVALVDADIDEPTLADDLRLDLEFGWLDTVRCGLPIREVAVHAVEDSLTLIPLVDVERAQTASAEEISLLVEDLRDRFDLVVIDGPAGDSSRLRPFTTAIDSAIIVRDGKRTNQAAVESFASRLTRSGVQGVGMVENFI
ncbi:Septum site-determining protein MinD [Rubripirellula lacrimiformis]|uniref:Septum site-determining protein MinD n=1 Tax=Rubripirellula lacrimiformis TaxID=1930273 RepID=A0A517N6D0_9BACT|nr:division plane positioning ATPase MipZ [Rubripirellula lacrimiformis]QDT02694.1 Septum site-determining protein MinD [Rubripirellula lacrimiformis]